MTDVMDWRSAPLEAGTRLLVEASAGTGKTWTIAVLYLRLVLERRLSPRQIVVATFTNRAADELRERLRDRLRGARDLAVVGVVPDQSGGPDHAWLSARWADAAQRADDQRRLDAALGDFDLAPIGTLHRLADRILREQPFATGAGLRGGGNGDGVELRDELVRDLRRILLQDEGHDLSRLAGALDGAPNATELDRALAALLAPGVVVAADDEAAAEALADPDLPARVRRVLDRRDALFIKNSVAARALEALGKVVGGAATWPETDAEDVVEGLGKLTTRTGFRKGSAVDSDLEWLVSNGEALAAGTRDVAVHRPVRAFWRAVGVWARAESRRRLEARGETSFDLLLETVHDALAAEDGVASRPLADALVAQWPAALVDEFQDTDPIQYGILDRIWRCDAGRPRGWLAVVGDPKQAIYRFRGGDIETYQRARKAATAQLILSTNHRSSTRFVSACNAFFGAGSGTLSARGDADIRYQRVTAAPLSRHPSGLRIDGAEPERPLMVRTLAGSDEGLKADDLIQRAITAAADEIAGMLGSGQYAIAGRALAPADIAVLVPANDHVSRMLAALAERNVPAVGSRQASVFESDTARDLVLVLEALVEPGEPVRRAALATRLMGARWETVRRLTTGPALAGDVEARLDHWRGIWQRLGVGAAIRMLAADIASRVLASGEGERVLTDLRHLGELLELASAEHHGMHAQLAWLKRQRRIVGGKEADVDARRLRLESDARRVQVITVHASKGLEFGIVFLPLAFRHGRSDEWRKAPLVRISDPSAQVGRLDVPEAVAAQAQQLESDERFRLLYVAVTRAVHACVVYDAPAPQNMADVPLAVLIARHGKSGTTGNGTSGAGNGRADIAGVEWRDGLPEPATWVVADVGLRARAARPMPPPAAGPRPERHSFTSLTHETTPATIEVIAGDSPAEDEAVAEPGFATLGESDADDALQPDDVEVDEAHPQLVAFASVGGTGFGNAVHAVLEHRVHGRRIVDQIDLVRRALDEHGVGDGRAPVDMSGLAAMLDRALEVPLWPGGPGVGELAPSAQRAEFDFLLSLPRLRMKALRRLAAGHDEAGLVPASDAEIAGLLRGKIDLVLRHDGRYHALDWKTNRLGVRLDDYLGAALDRAMDRDRYRFQALLYTLALHRHLRARLRGYDRSLHLGDPVYVFVRAAGLAPGAGVWSSPFAPEFLDAVDALLDGREAMEPAA
jgi:exodeoxyribonuclease V beta subunit